MGTPKRVPAHGRRRSVRLPSPSRGARLPPLLGRFSLSHGARGRVGRRRGLRTRLPHLIFPLSPLASSLGLGGPWRWGGDGVGDDNDRRRPRDGDCSATTPRRSPSATAPGPAPLAVRHRARRERRRGDDGWLKIEREERGDGDDQIRPPRVAAAVGHQPATGGGLPRAAAATRSGASCRRRAGGWGGRRLSARRQLGRARREAMAVAGEGEDGGDGDARERGE
ncbi:Os06g0174500 [Oryza sativa Japonica Group]|uniref:Os06g0174500 protein n=1 Tax=Oryza sativa subsp. japonica TaxID=39947 RepID=A0A0P0WTJ3_ORYSJ|nr:Os06g0174500 [Oryza sativa Japonica Group]